uniref:RND family efflux transporter, MFP subunit n=1 Tax=Candidatus Kentrum sp. FW TaxID=2126338 RepID=A0A450SIM9_9GAMM|nr:MAG: RND family efflux transporter, MFP subunit [Candidatus Kentron sp. FW]VFJ66865.1 MAG: RND family efflux transporter, MFP subunit [Candidatus Kentron sp. FW]
MRKSSIPFILAAVAVSLAAVWVSNPFQEESPPAAPKTRPPPKVRVVEVRPETHVGHLIGYGEAKARYDLQLTAQVAGRIMAVDDGVESGKTVTPEQVLFRIDETPLRMALAEAEQSLADARLKLARERGQANRAKEEWASADFDASPSPLTFRKPQLATASTAIRAAGARLENAKNDLAHARVSAPFPALVVERLVGPGDFVSVGTPLAHLVSLDRVEIRVSLSVGQWSIIDATPNRRVEVRTQSGASWLGYVLRAERHVSTEDRQRALVIAVDAPLEQRPPLYPGTFVTVALSSKPIQSAWLLPASALDGDGYLWRIDADHQVRRLKPRVFHRFDDVVVAVPPETVEEAVIVVKPLASLTPGTLVAPIEVSPTDGRVTVEAP